MPNIVSAKKRLRQNKKRNLLNRHIKSTLNTLRKKTLKLIEANDKEASINAYNEYASKIDKAARKNTIHENRARMKKSTLMSKINSIK